MQSTEVEETLERIKSHPGECLAQRRRRRLRFAIAGVEGVIIVNSEGVPIRPSKGMDEEMTREYAAQLSQLALKARSVVRDLDPQVQSYRADRFRRLHVRAAERSHLPAYPLGEARDYGRAR
jgi:hypothetical protein